MSWRIRRVARVAVKMVSRGTSQQSDGGPALNRMAPWQPGRPRNGDTPGIDTGAAFAAPAPRCRVSCLARERIEKD
jgi:hypothetical protein